MSRAPVTPAPQDDDDGGFLRDLRRMRSRRAALGTLALGAGGAVWWLTGGRARATVSGTAADGGICILPPEETAGPFPADGTNARAGQTVNVLAETGVERSDLRDSFGGWRGRAEGVRIDLEIRLVDVDSACAPLDGLALYLWSCDAPGNYSLYTLPEANYLRGLQVSGADGLIRFTTILPGCYPGRWPHFHFEVFAGREAAVTGRAALLTAQLALPAAQSQPIYESDTRYGDSLIHFGRLTLEGDNIFRDNTPEERAAQTIVLEGTAEAGFTGRVTVGLRR